MSSTLYCFKIEVLHQIFKDFSRSNFPCVFLSHIIINIVFIQCLFLKLKRKYKYFSEFVYSTIFTFCLKKFKIKEIKQNFKKILAKRFPPFCLIW